MRGVLVGLLLSSAVSAVPQLTYMFRDAVKAQAFRREFEDGLCKEFTITSYSAMTPEESKHLSDRETVYYKVSPLIRRFQTGGVNVLVQKKTRVGDSSETVWKFYAVSYNGALVGKFTVKADDSIATFAMEEKNGFSRTFLSQVGASLKSHFVNMAAAFGVSEESIKNAGKRFL